MTNLPEKMKAIVAYAPGDYRLEEVETPRAGEGEMILKVEVCGICAGDVKAFGGAASFWGLDGQPKYIKAPMIPGHEFVGNGKKCKGKLEARRPHLPGTDRAVRGMPLLQERKALDV